MTENPLDEKPIDERKYDVTTRNIDSSLYEN